MRLALAIGNKNYSSWSMRPWVLLTEAQIPFEEIQLWFDSDARVQGGERYSPTRQVPVLLIDSDPVWDSLAICETLAELFPEKKLWPDDARGRQIARSICAEMHAGFRNLRSAMPMNIRARHPGKGMSPEVQEDIDRVFTLWRACRSAYGTGGDMLFGRFGIADAYYAPVVMRFVTYEVNLPPDMQRYVDAVRELGSVQAWIRDAVKETQFVAADEPYANA